MHKKGHVNTAYQRRWFVLQHGCLKYYPKKPARDDVEPRGYVELQNCDIEEDLGTHDDDAGFLFAIKGSSRRRIILSVESAAERAEWVYLIRCICEKGSMTVDAKDGSNCLRIYQAKYGRNLFLRTPDGETSAKWINTVSLKALESLCEEGAARQSYGARSGSACSC